MHTEIITERLRLRRSQPDDFKAMHALVSDYAVVSHTGTWPWPADPDFTRARCQPMAPEMGMAGPVFAGNDMVGMMGINAREDSAEMGYLIAPMHQGNGFATEIGRALIAHVWATYDWPAVEACVFADNPASVRVLEKLGFDEGAACEGDCAARGGRFPTRTFCLVRPVSDTETGPNSLKEFGAA